MLVAMELSGWLNESSLALQAVIQSYGLLAPLIHYRIPAVPIMQVRVNTCQPGICFGGTISKTKPNPNRNPKPNHNPDSNPNLKSNPNYKPNPKPNPNLDCNRNPNVKSKPNTSPNPKPNPNPDDNRIPAIVVFNVPFCCNSRLKGSLLTYACCINVLTVMFVCQINNF